MVAKETSRAMERKSLVNAYQNAGGDFLAVKVVSKVFRKIETEADKVRHNDAMDEIGLLVEADNIGFLKQVSDTLLNMMKSADKNRKIFLNRIATTIIQIGNKQKKDEK